MVKPIPIIQAGYARIKNQTKLMFGSHADPVIFDRVKLEQKMMIGMINRFVK
jgi:hypothetical protein